MEHDVPSDTQDNRNNHIFTLQHIYCDAYDALPQIYRNVSQHTTFGYVSPPSIGALTPPKHDQYHFDYSISRNCYITRSSSIPFRKHYVLTKALIVMPFGYPRIQWSASTYDFFFLKMLFFVAMWFSGSFSIDRQKLHWNWFGNLAVIAV